MFREGFFKLERKVVKAEDKDAAACSADGDDLVVVVLKAKIERSIIVGEGKREDIFVCAEIPSDHAAIFAARNEKDRTTGLNGEGVDGFSEVCAGEGMFDRCAAEIPRDDIVVAAGGEKRFPVVCDIESGDRCVVFVEQGGRTK